MKNYRFYLYVTLSVITLLVLSCIIITPIIVKSQITTSLDNHISLAQQNTKELTQLSGEFFTDAVSKKKIINGIQNGVKYTYDQTIFISIIDWSGKILAHPDLTLLGTQVNQDKSPASNVENKITGDILYEQIITAERTLDTSLSSIIYLEAIPESDMMIASHINYENIERAIARTKNHAHLIFFITGLISLLSLLMTTRVLSTYYEAQLDKKSVKIEDSVFNMSKLNKSINEYQENLLEIKNKTPETPIDQVPNEHGKQRLLTYVRNELRPINIENIAYIYVENKVTYIVSLEKKRSVSNESLDQIYNSLNEKFFFRVNRQIILNIKAIDKIIKYGNNTLKIQTKPDSEVDIIIGKNKSSSFRQWLDL